MSGTAFLNSLRALVGRRHVLTSDSATYRYRKGFRCGEGPVLAVVRPGSLVELWRVAQACVSAGKIVLMQAANTGLTGGSVPDGNGYDREIVLINTLRLAKIHVIGGGRQVVCLPGATLHALEHLLAPLGREPHSVIGSSCLGASVLGGVSNNSGGALVQRGPAYTEMAVFGQVGADGVLRLVNHLGIPLGPDSGEMEPEAMLAALERGAFDESRIDWTAGKGHDARYATRVRDVEADSPARFNANPQNWHDAAGCAGRLVVFAARLDTFPAQKDTATFYIGTNTPDVLETLRRDVLTGFPELPIAGEYVHREAFEITERYGRDMVALIRLIGTKRLPRWFAMKARFDGFAAQSRFLPPALADHVLQAFSKCLPSQILPRLAAYRDRFEHHLMLKVSGTMAEAMRAHLAVFFTGHEGDWFACTPKEGARAFLHRFAVAGAAIRYQTMHRRTCAALVPLDVALRRNDRDWFERLPPALAEKLAARVYYGHFFCHVMHQEYVVRNGFDPETVKHDLLALLDARGAKYPAEHNVGHLYAAPPEMAAHYRALDPCNCLNPGIGKTSRKRNWAAESV
ncbi:D-lactate dehydrogenase [Acidomonas methanolica]|uniref:Quinone-dependent D-lactate dehydrogenase n=1 Tax=Acidomonas methanolica NBRC 104435 TaxID=1231351 RepID=A0A023D3B4_ACIMT|nr:D-lactate dehydrogenase [Acidomonas methanolica]MBU2654489.1 D-lactate dehydrogenase [Acidomonas methanolica]TCS28292.1 D-lactate dehydrogenase [Acidomonas methanolica]GAJ28574.1 D-lactate dehydrogenase [Acidomonas methanolica NBRC 104435]GBQ45348.1 D-lactate dehydrogenase [Acidomonas methanolica]GEK99009.1 D-lactate dehydrogenase [Acidomonas methanolica NBRC 104435]